MKKKLVGMLATATLLTMALAGNVQAAEIRSVGPDGEAAVDASTKIFMFDEPTAGVDIVAKGEIISIIREFADKGGAVIFASSELAEMMAICDDIITIFDGKITGRIGRKELMKEEELQHAIQRK